VGFIVMPRCEMRESAVGGISHNGGYPLTDLFHNVSGNVMLDPVKKRWEKLGSLRVNCFDLLTNQIKSIFLAKKINPNQTKSNFLYSRAGPMVPLT
jgi:hypothetical protein